MSHLSRSRFSSAWESVTVVTAMRRKGYTPAKRRNEPQIDFSFKCFGEALVIYSKVLYTLEEALRGVAGWCQKAWRA